MGFFPLFYVCFKCKIRMRTYGIHHNKNFDQKTTKGPFFTPFLTCCAVAFKNLLNLRILSAEMEKMSHHLMLQSPTFFFKYAVKNCSQHIHKNAVKVIWMSENCLLANCTYCQCHYEEKALNRCCKDFHNNSNLSSTFKNITIFFDIFEARRSFCFKLKVYNI